MKLVRPVFGLAILLLIGTRPAAAAPITYANEAAFIGAAGGLGFESFEALTATNSVSPAFTATLAAFTLVGNPQAGVFDQADYAGTHAIDGKNYFEVEGGAQQFLTFTFLSPIKAFGVTITDYGDTPHDGAPLTFTTNTGVTGTAALNGANANDQFFGLIDNTNPFSTLTLRTGVGPFGEPFSVDAVRFSTSETNAVPEPATVLLVGSGIVAAMRKRRR